MSPYSRQEIIELYEDHPVREAAILERILAERGSLEGLTELDLAGGVGTQRSDQNHVGGTRLLDELARGLAIDADTRVFDVGCGLGGSARYLAFRYGCSVHGVDLSPTRVREAIHLTELVGLADRVRFEAADFLTCELPAGGYDVVLSQAVAIHVEAEEHLLERALRLLVPGGWVVLEEPVSRTSAGERATDPEALARLEKLWKGQVRSLEHWRRILADAPAGGFDEEDLSEQFLAHHRRLLTTARDPRRPAPPADEHAAWTLAERLARCGALGYARFRVRAGT